MELAKGIEPRLYRMTGRGETKDGIAVPLSKAQGQPADSSEWRS
jgi:hypothetical protein